MGRAQDMSHIDFVLFNLPWLLTSFLNLEYMQLFVRRQCDAANFFFFFLLNKALFHASFHACYVQLCSTSLIKSGLAPSTRQRGVSLVLWPESTNSTGCQFAADLEAN